MLSSSKTMKRYLMNQKKSIIFSENENKQSVFYESTDLAKSVIELLNINGVEHLDFHSYISGLCFYDSV